MAAVHVFIDDGLNLRKSYEKLFPKMFSDRQIERHVGDRNEITEFIFLSLRVIEPLVTCDGSWIYDPYLETSRQNEQ